MQHKMHLQLKTDLIGTEYNTKCSGACFIVDYKSTKDVTVMFYDGYTVKTQMSNLRRGNLRNPYHPNNKLYGFGITDIKGCDKNVRDKDYRLWESMIARAYSAKYHEKFPTYEEVTVHKDWTRFSSFKKDISKFIGYDKLDSKGWVLDKDLLLRGNKVYSKDTCVFVPEQINLLLLNSKINSSGLPLGVHFCNREKRYVAQIRYEGKSQHLGYYTCPDIAFKAYQKAKRVVINKVAEKYKDVLDVRVYEALLNWEIGY